MWNLLPTCTDLYFCQIYRELQTTGSTLKINEIYDESDDVGPEPYQAETKVLDFIGEPVDNFTKLAQEMVQLDENGFVKKKIIEEGGGLELHEGCTVSIAFSCYWEDSSEPFDTKTLRKPMVRLVLYYIFITFSNLRSQIEQISKYIDMRM